MSVGNDITNISKAEKANGWFLKIILATLPIAIISLGSLMYNLNNSIIRIESVIKHQNASIQQQNLALEKLSDKTVTKEVLDNYKNIMDLRLQQLGFIIDGVDRRLNLVEERNRGGN